MTFESHVSTSTTDFNKNYIQATNKFSSSSSLSLSLSLSLTSYLYFKDFESSVEQKPQPYRLRSRSARRKTFTLRPKFGVMSPTVSFYEYNKDRADNVRKREREGGSEGWRT